MIWIKQKKNFPAQFWSLSKEDFILFFVSLSVQFFIFVTYYIRHKSVLVSLSYQDSISSLVQECFLFQSNETIQNQIKNSVSSGYSCSFFYRKKLIPIQPSFSTHSIIIRIFKSLLKFLRLSKLFKPLIGSQFISIIMISLLSCYSMRRMLLLYGFISNVFIVSIVLSMFPMRWAFIKTCSTSDTLLSVFFNFAFIFFGIEKWWCFCLLIISIFLAALTRPEGFFFYLIFSLSVLITKSKSKTTETDSNNIQKYLPSLLSLMKSIFLALIGLIHFYYAQNYFYPEDLMTYIAFPNPYDKFPLNMPFNFLSSYISSISSLRETHAAIILFAPLIIGGFSLLFSSSSTIPLGLYILTFTIFISCFDDQIASSMYRVIIYPEAISFILLIDVITTKVKSIIECESVFQILIICVLTFMMFFDCLFSINQIYSAVFNVSIFLLFPN